MKKIAALLLAALLALAAGLALGETDEELLTVTLYGRAYKLGACTPDDFAQNGFGVSVQPDGTVALLDENTGESIYAVLSGGFVTGLDFQWDAGVSYAYCGLTEQNTWDDVQRKFGAEMNEEGALEAHIALTNGQTLEIYTHGERLSVELDTSARPAAPSAGISSVIAGREASVQADEAAWPELESVKALSADDIEQIERITYTEGGAERVVLTDRTAVSGVHALCCVLALGEETDIGVADDGLTLTFVTAEGSPALRFEGNYAVIGSKRYEVENLNLLKTYLKTVTEGQPVSAAQSAPKTGTESAQTPGASPAEEMQILPTEAQSVAFEPYSEPNGLFTMQLPAGWKVETGGDYIGYTINAYDPNRSERGVYLMLSGAGYGSQEAASIMQSYGADLPTLPNATTQGFFTDWLAGLGCTVSVLERLGASETEDVLHVQTTFPGGVQAEGLYSAAVGQLSYNYGVDLSMTMATGIIMLNAAPGELNDWLPVLEKTLGSIQFSNGFMQQRNAQWQQVMGTSAYIAQTYNEISEMTMSAWENRSASLDIRMQQQSDATLGYDRVVDTETGSVYRIDVGTFDRADTDRFRLLEQGSTLYNQPLSGYITWK